MTKSVSQALFFMVHFLFNLEGPKISHMVVSCSSLGVAKLAVKALGDTSGEQTSL